MVSPSTLLLLGLLGSTAVIGGVLSMSFGQNGLFNRSDEINDDLGVGDGKDKLDYNGGEDGLEVGEEVSDSLFFFGFLSVIRLDSDANVPLALSEFDIENLPNLGYAIEETDKAFADFESECEEFGFCIWENYPSAFHVDLNEATFDRLFSSLSPELVDEREHGESAVVLHREVIQLPGGGERVVEEREIVRRPAEAGEESIPPRMEKVYIRDISYGDLEYRVTLFTEWLIEA
ncbi:MAG: hypothetical protein V3U49_08365 [Nitrososphaerales archaeon]